MDWTVVVAFVAAFLGSTGVASLVTGGVQLSRSARLRHGIAASSALLPNLAEGTASRQSLLLAIEADALRLSAMSLLRAPARMGQLLVIVIVFFVAGIALLQTSPLFLLDAKLHNVTTAEQGLLSFSTVVTISFMLGYVAALVFALDSAIRLRREQYIRAIMTSREMSYDIVMLHDFRANRVDDHRAAQRRERTQRDLASEGILEVSNPDRAQRVTGDRRFFRFPRR